MQKFNFNFLGEIKNDYFTFNCLKLFLDEKPVDLVWLHMLFVNNQEHLLAFNTSQEIKIVDNLRQNYCIYGLQIDDCLYYQLVGDYYFEDPLYPTFLGVNKA